MKLKLKNLFYKSRRWLAAVLCVILCIQAVEPLGATIAKLTGQKGNHIELLDAPGVDKDVFDSMDLYIEQRGEIFAFDLEFTVAKNRILTEEETESSEVESTTQEFTKDDETMEETSKEESTEGTVAEDTTMEGATTEENTAESTTEEPTVETSSAVESSKEDVSTPDNSVEESVESKATEVENRAEESTKGSTSKDVEADVEAEMEKIIHEMESLYTEAERKEVLILERSELEQQELEQPKSEQLEFEVDFTDAFYLLESPGDRNVLNEEGKPIGRFELSEKDGKISLIVTFDVPIEREESYEGSIQFSLGNSSGMEGDVTLLWDAEAEAVDVEIEETWIGSLLERFALRDMEAYEPKASRTPDPTSKNVEFDLMNQLPAEITRMYDSLKLVMSIPRASGNGVMNTDLNIRIDAEMKNSFLTEELGSVEDIILNWLDKAGNENKGIDGWLQENSSEVEAMPDLTFSIEFEDSEDNLATVEDETLTFEVIPGSTSSAIEIEGQEYGTYTLAKNDKKVTMTCALSKRLYGMKNVKFGADFSLNAVKALNQREVPTFEMSNGKISCNGSALHFLETEPSDKKPYTLIKTIEGDEKKSSDTPYVTFKVEVDSYENLAGSSIVDELPIDLQLSGLRLKCDDGSEIELGKDKYTYADNKIEYKFPTDSTVKKAVLYVDAVLTPEKVFQMTNASTEEGQTAAFTNKAYMKDKTNNKLTETEGEASGKKRFQMFQKNGKQNAADGSILDWTIDIDVSFQGSLDVYLLDSLDPTTHDYIDGGKLIIETGKIVEGNFESESTTEVAIRKTDTIVTNRDYDNVSAETLNTITGNDLSKAYYYESSENENVMALNLKNYIGTNGKHIRVKYSTKIVGLNNETGEDGKKEFKNFADLRWKALYWGNGPGTVDVDLTYTINKPVEATINMAVKRAGAYDATKQLQTWYFDVNHYGMEYEDMVITEDLSSSVDQRIPDDDGGGVKEEWLCRITQVHKGVGFTVDKIKRGTVGDTKPYYTKTGQKVEIYLGNISADDYFTIAFQTKVGGAAVSGNTKDYSLTNTANIRTKTGATEVVKAATEVTEIPNTLLKKEALKADGSISDGKVNGYNAQTGELFWRISVNPNSLHIKNGIITDTLPIAESKAGEHNKFGRVTKVTYGTEGSIEQTTNADVTKYTGETGENLISIGASGISIKIDKTTNPEEVEFKIMNVAGTNAVDIQKPLVIEFTTKLMDTVVADLYKDERSKKADTRGTFVETYKNVACLDGTIVNPVDTGMVTTIDSTKAKDEASHHVAIREMQKGGKYGENGVGVIRWDAVINEAHSTIGGLTLKDELSTQIEYKKDSLELFEITGFNLDGTVLSKTKIEIGDLKTTYGFKENKDAKNNTIGFELKFPPNDTKAYYISFDTLLVEDAKPSAIKNQLMLQDGSENKLVSNEANGGSDQQFYVDDYATGTQVPLLVLEKVSSSKDENGKYQIKFENVDFDIHQIKRVSDAWGPMEKVNTKITNEKGRKLFFGVEKGDIFKISEVAATVPVGYTKMTDKFVYFKTEEDKGKPTGTPKTPEELRITIKSATDVPNSTPDADIYLVDSLYKRLILENTPDAASNAGKVQFVKQNEMGAPIKDVKYQLKHSKGWVKTKEAISGADGKVTFENVDPTKGDAYYTLTELSSVEPYRLDKTSYKLTVNVTGDDITYKITDNVGTELPKVTVDGADLYQIKNKLATASLEITKKDSITKATLEDAEYTLTGTDYLGRDITKVLPMPGPGPFKTDDSGKVTISGIPVNKSGKFYTLTETVYPGGYQQSSDKKIAYKVTVTPTESVVNAAESYKDYKAEVNIEKLSDAPDADSFTQVNEAGTAKVTLLNTPVIGKITFTKVGVIRGTETGLGGVTFGLYTDAACTKPAKDSNEVDLVDVSASSVDIGKVEFDNVYYGNYYLKEKKSSDRPKGYLISQEVARITMTPSDIQKTVGATTTTYSFTKEVPPTEQEKLKNPIASAQIQIKKTNQNGEILPGVKFSIKRYGDDSTAVPIGNTFVNYPVPTVDSGSNIATADASGIVDFGDVVYGTYCITETEIPPQYDLIVNQEPFYLKVGIETNSTTGTQTVKVVKYDTEPTDKSPESMTGGTILTANGETGVYTFPVINELKYGLIQLNKVAATKMVEESDTTYSISATEDKANTIEDVFFEIYRDTDVTLGGASASLKPDATAYVTLKTNEKGQFEYITTVGEDQYSYEDVYSKTEGGKNKGDKTGKKVKLLLGSYYIREIEAPSGYVVDTALYPFTLNQSHYTKITNADDSRYEWIKNTGTATVLLNGTSTEIPYFINEIVRATVTLDKVKKDNSTIDTAVKLKNATFVVYTDETIPKAVASLKWDETAQKYLLSNANPLPEEVTFTEGNAQGIPFVSQNETTRIYELVAGKYFVDEAITPNGYHVEKEESAEGFHGRKKYQFTINSIAERVITNEAAPHDNRFTNTLGRGAITVKKTIDSNDSNASVVTEVQKEPNGFQFTLTPKSIDSGLDYTSQTVTVLGGNATTAGTATFTDVPYGTYTLTETKGTKNGYQLMGATELNVSQSGVKITSNLTGRTDVAYNSTNKTIEVKNTLIHADINGTKYGSVGDAYGGTQKKLPGALFALYSDHAGNTEVCEADAVTDANGNFTFTNIPFGTYWVKEKTAPTGYEPSTEIVEVTIPESGAQVTIADGKFINTLKKSKLKLVKTDFNTGESVSGAVFTIFGKEGEAKDKVVAYLTESAQPGIYTISNQAEGDTAVAYTNAVGLNHLLYQNTGEAYYLAVGDYYYKETTTPKYYQKNSNTVDFTITGSAEGSLETLSPITNTRELTDVSFQKVDKKNGSYNESGEFVPYGIAGITFTLYSDEACSTVVQTAISSGDLADDKSVGEVLFTGLLPGTYYIKEVAVPNVGSTPMYLPNDAIYRLTIDEDVSDGLDIPKITLVSGSGETIEQIENEANPDLEVRLTMKLRSRAGVPLPNAVFRLFRNGVYYATVRTDVDGFVDFGNVLPAMYILAQDTSSDNHIPIIDPIEKKVENPIETGIYEYHIPVINEKPEEEKKEDNSENKGNSSGSSSGSSKPTVGTKKDESIPEIPFQNPPDAPERIVPDVIPSNMVLEKDIEEIKQFFDNLEEEQLTAEDLANKEKWRKEFQKNSKYWQEKFGMDKEEWKSWMAANFGANYQMLPKTGGMMGTILIALIGLGLAGYGAYETFGRRNKKCGKKKKK